MFDIEVLQVTAILLCDVLGHLLIVDSKQEFDAVAPSGSTKYWIDMMHLQSNGVYISSLTGRRGYEEWDNGEPGNITLRSCVFIANKKMTNWICYDKLRFICEIQ